MSEQPLPCDEDLRVALATSGAVLASGLSDGELAGVEETSASASRLTIGDS